jgi:hypothetical protein
MIRGMGREPNLRKFPSLVESPPEGIDTVVGDRAYRLPRRRASQMPISS